ncbi:GNAT family N-acetyltransferase [Streptomyces sp. NPDC001584]|uniref:GNAT family N-acetyltransferase n=1 Tax=Streptomyces sp. NPDC001584 TaxID=3154521 RepID=UPI003321A2A0
MDASLYRIRPLQAADIETVLELMAQANPAYDAQSLVAHRLLLQLATAPDRGGPSEDSLRVMAEELASDGLDADAVYRMLSERAAVTGGDLTAGTLLTLVAEETATGAVVGMVNAGPPGKWVHHALSQLPAPMVHQMRERVVEILDIAVSAAARRRGIGSELLSAVLNGDSDAARGWRLAIWFFHEGSGMGDFHRRMAPEWPINQPIAFLDSAQGVEPFRNLSGDLRACVAPLHPDLQLVMDPKGRAAIRGIFDQPWPTASSRASAERSKPSKAERKAGKKSRGRARG